MTFGAVALCVVLVFLIRACYVRHAEAAAQVRERVAARAASHGTECENARTQRPLLHVEMAGMLGGAAELAPAEVPAV